MYVGITSVEGVYFLIHQILYNSIDEFLLGNGGKIELRINDNIEISVRDYGSGIPFDKILVIVIDAKYSTKINSKSLKKTFYGIVMDGIGLSAINALSSSFLIPSFRNKRTKTFTFSKGV